MGALRGKKTGFTLVEVVVVAPIVILAIGAFIAGIVALTGEVLSSRAANTMTYDVQDGLSQIERDIKASSAFLARTTVPFTAANPQGVGSGNTGAFVNASTTAPGTALILAVMAKDKNPLTSSAQYSYKNGNPLVMNIVYFVDQGSLWRRTIMPSDYATYSPAPWDLPSCARTNTHSFCRSQDIEVIKDIDSFAVSYFITPGATVAIANAANPGATLQTRSTALLGVVSADVAVSTSKKSAGRDITRQSSVRATRSSSASTIIDSNSDITVTDGTVATLPTLAGDRAISIDRGAVVDGSDVIFTWGQVQDAESYDVQFRKKATASATWSSWATAVSNVNNSNRTYKTSGDHHGQVVQVQVRACNLQPARTCSNWVASAEKTIPLWAPLILRNNWSMYGAQYNPPSYTMTSSGMVLFRGLIKLGTTTMNVVLADIPSKYRPSDKLIFGTTTSGTAHGRVDVLANGTVVMNAGDSGYLSLEMVRYLPHTNNITGATRTWVTPAFIARTPAFENWGSGHVPARLGLDGIGRVHMQGLIKGGTVADGTDVFLLPAAYRPSLYEIHATRSTGFQNLGIYRNTAVAAASDSAAALRMRGNGATSSSSINFNYLPYSYTATTWTSLTLANSWTNYSASFNSVQCTRSADGVVNVRGLIRNGTRTSGTVITTLPTTCGRPKYRIIHTTMDGNGIEARVDVLANGQIVYMSGGTVVGNWVSLDNLVFMNES